MKRIFASACAWLAVLLLASCGSHGSSSSAPSNVKVAAGDTTAVVTWDMQPGVTYWVWRTAGTFIDISSCGALCTTVVDVTSPMVVTGLTNGVTYSFSINGRENGGPGGPGSPSISATPRLAGGLDSRNLSTWSTLTPFAGVQDMRGIAFGVPSLNTLVTRLANTVGTGVYTAVGSNGALYYATVSNADGTYSWLPANTSPVNANLNAVMYNSGKFVAVGDGGTILLSYDGVAWAAEASGTNKDLYGVANYGGGFIAVGANGAMLTSGDGVNWGAIGPFTMSTLYGVAYGKPANAGLGGMYVAVGAAGALLYSTDGVSWFSGQASTSLPDIRSVAFGMPQLPYNNYTTQTLPVATYVAVGANGLLLTSQDGMNWTVQPAVPLTTASTLNSVTYGHQFVAVGDNGAIVDSPDGLTWTLVQQPLPASPNLYSLIPAAYVGGPYANLYLYSAVGANGANLIAQ